MRKIVLFHLLKVTQSCFKCPTVHDALKLFLYEINVTLLQNIFHLSTSEPRQGRCDLYRDLLIVSCDTFLCSGYNKLFYGYVKALVALG